MGRIFWSKLPKCNNCLQVHDFHFHRLQWPRIFVRWQTKITLIKLSTFRKVHSNPYKRLSKCVIFHHLTISTLKHVSIYFCISNTSPKECHSFCPSSMLFSKEIYTRMCIATDKRFAMLTINYHLFISLLFNSDFKITVMKTFRSHLKVSSLVPY